MANQIKEGIADTTPKYTGIMSAEVRRDNLFANNKVIHPFVSFFPYLLISLFYKQRPEEILHDKLKDSIAVILVISQDFIENEDCRNEVSLANSYRKVLLFLLFLIFSDY